MAKHSLRISTEKCLLVGLLLADLVGVPSISTVARAYGEDAGGAAMPAVAIAPAASSPASVETTGSRFYDDILTLNSQLSHANVRLDATAVALKYLSIGMPLKDVHTVLRALDCHFGRSAPGSRFSQYAMRELPGNYFERRYLIVEWIWKREGTRIVISDIRAELQNRVPSDL